MPDKITTEMPALRACSPTDDIANPVGKRFTSGRLHLDTGETMVRAVEEYAQAVAQSYTQSTEERDTLRKADQEREGKQQVTAPAHPAGCNR